MDEKQDEYDSPQSVQEMKIEYEYERSINGININQTP
tara:strand:- start:262 stop:372 length:111 start_codon:yes stop_codon:yes gene_type:complete